MKRTRLLSILLAVLLVFSFSAAALAADPMTVTVETITDAVSAGEEVSLAVSVAGNPGFTNYEWAVNYDADALELKNVESKLNAFFDTREEKAGQVNLVFANAKPISENGTILVVTFLVKEGAAAGLSEVSISSTKLASVSQKITATYVAGGVTVTASTGGSTTGGSTTGGSTTGGSTTGGSTTGGSTTGGSTTGGSTTGGSTTGGSTTGGSTTGGSTTGGSTTGGSTTGGSTTGGSTTGGSTTGSERTVELVGESNGATYKTTGNTLNVQNDAACVVLWTDDNGKTYTEVAATLNEAGGYDFNLTNLPKDAVIKIAVMGDFNMDGSVDALDAVMVNRAAAGLLSYSELQNYVGHVGESSTLDGLDALLINRAAASMYTIAW